MTKLLEKAVEAARRLPQDQQDEIAGAILQLLGGDGGPEVSLTAQEREAIARSREAAARGEFASEEDVRSVWARHIP
ncbi:hypothetical protein MesoLjLc_64420 [Mesorhizobium sp. L-8-10]|uniref:hypothetical protein n=1 Tax=Mesorhizobium sp. L-8-10 TaxID=2744523 RepID=UPI001925AFBE|nr:hypothetical protein [Mesorhizobium sp. L-8-10]BCH34512.1 hypothetical protein MesoLjLc_64420 [Mesorhizobium sp. L-8-10]